MSEESGMRASSSISTLTCHPSSSAGTTAVTISGGVPAISSRKSMARRAASWELIRPSRRPSPPWSPPCSGRWSLRLSANPHLTVVRARPRAFRPQQVVEDPLLQLVGALRREVAGSARGLDLGQAAGEGFPAGVLLLRVRADLLAQPHRHPDGGERERQQAGDQSHPDPRGTVTASPVATTSPAKW